MRYYCYETDMKVIKLAFYALLLLFVAALAYAAGILQVFEDGSFIIALDGLRMTGCIPGFICGL